MSFNVTMAEYRPISQKTDGIETETNSLGYIIPKGWMTLESPTDTFKNEKIRTRARQYSIAKDIKDSKQEFMPIIHPKTKKIEARVYRKAIVLNPFAPSMLGEGGIDPSMNVTKVMDRLIEIAMETDAMFKNACKTDEQVIKDQQEEKDRAKIEVHQQNLMDKIADASEEGKYFHKGSQSIESITSYSCSWLEKIKRVEQLEEDLGYAILVNCSRQEWTYWHQALNRINDTIRELEHCTKVAKDAAAEFRANYEEKCDRMQRSCQSKSKDHEQARKLIESLYKEDRKKVIEVEVEAARQKRRNDEVIHELRRRHAVGQPPGIPNKDETTKYKRRMQIIQYLNEKVNQTEALIEVCKKEVEDNREKLDQGYREAENEYKAAEELLRTINPRDDDPAWRREQVKTLNRLKELRDENYAVGKESLAKMESTLKQYRELHCKYQRENILDSIQKKIDDKDMQIKQCIETIRRKKDECTQSIKFIEETSKGLEPATIAQKKKRQKEESADAIEKEQKCIKNHIDVKKKLENYKRTRDLDMLDQVIESSDRESKIMDKKVEEAKKAEEEAKEQNLPQEEIVKRMRIHDQALNESLQHAHTKQNYREIQLEQIKLMNTEMNNNTKTEHQKLLDERAEVHKNRLEIISNLTTIRRDNVLNDPSIPDGEKSKCLRKIRENEKRLRQSAEKRERTQIMEWEDEPTPDNSSPSEDESEKGATGHTKDDATAKQLQNYIDQTFCRPNSKSDRKAIEKFRVKKPDKDIGRKHKPGEKLTDGTWENINGEWRKADASKKLKIGSRSYDDDDDSDNPPDLVTTCSESSDDENDNWQPGTISAITIASDDSDTETTTNSADEGSTPSSHEHENEDLSTTHACANPAMPDDISVNEEYTKSAEKQIMKFIMTLFKLDRKSKKAREKSLEQQNRSMNKPQAQAEREKLARIREDNSMKQYVKTKKQDFDNNPSIQRPKTGVELLFSITKQLEEAPPPEEGITNYLMGILQEIKRQDEHKKGKECSECEPSQEDKMTELEMTDELPSKHEMACKIRKTLRKVNKELQQHSEATCQCGVKNTHAASATINAPRLFVKKKRNDISDYHEEFIGVHPSALGGRTRLLSDVNDSLATNNTHTRSVRLQMESYWDAAFRLGPDGLANYRKQIEKELIEEIKDLMTDRDMNDIMHEVCEDAKAEYQRYREMEKKIKSRADKLKDPEEWKKWDPEWLQICRESGKERASEILRIDPDNASEEDEEVESDGNKRRSDEA